MDIIKLQVNSSAIVTMGPMALTVVLEREVTVKPPSSLSLLFYFSDQVCFHSDKILLVERLNRVFGQCSSQRLVCWEDRL